MSPGSDRFRHPEVTSALARAVAVMLMGAAANTKLADAIPVCTGLAVGSTCGYLNFASQSLTMVITPTA